MKALGSIFRILSGIVLTATVISNLALAYIVFMPDYLPKPFYLMYATAPAVGLEGLPIFDPGSILPQETQTPSQTEEMVPTVDMEHLQPGQGIMLDTGTKIVNLSEPGGRKFVRVNVVLEFAPESAEYFTAEEEVKSEIITAFTSAIAVRLPVINDILVTILSSKSFEQVYTSEGKDTLREEIIREINTRLPEYKVTYVYFTEFAVQ